MNVSLDNRTNVWFRRSRVDGVRKAFRLGKFPDRESAVRAAELSINRTVDPPFAEVATRYMLEKMPERQTTSFSYRGRIENIVLPRWGSLKISEIKPIDLDRWFSTLGMAATTKAGIKTVMRQVFEYAMLCEMVAVQRNPLELVKLRGSSRRSRKPQILTPEDCRRLVAGIQVEPFRTMVYIALCLGIRRSELTGLIWSDIDWIQGTITIQRSVVENKPDSVKTEASEKALPLDPALTAMLQEWRDVTAYKADSDWVWASPKQGGALPFYPNAIQKSYLVPAGRAAGLGDHVGWHTLRHAYRTLLATAGTSLTVQRDLLRHSNIGQTGQYGGALPDDQRAAQSAVTRLILQ